VCILHRYETFFNKKGMKQILNPGGITYHHSTIKGAKAKQLHKQSALLAKEMACQTLSLNKPNNLGRVKLSTFRTMTP